MQTAKGQAEPYINVTPLIDVLLVLLIIFMVVTPLKPSRFKADIPTQRDPNEDVSQLKPNPLTLVVTIGQDLQLKLNQDVMGSVNDPSALGGEAAADFSTAQHRARLQSRHGNPRDLPGRSDELKRLYL